MIAKLLSEKAAKPVSRRTALLTGLRAGALAQLNIAGIAVPASSSASLAAAAVRSVFLFGPMLAVARDASPNLCVNSLADALGLNLSGNPHEPILKVLEVFGGSDYRGSAIQDEFEFAWSGKLVDLARFKVEQGPLISVSPEVVKLAELSTPDVYPKLGLTSDQKARIVAGETKIYRGCYGDWFPQEGEDRRVALLRYVGAKHGNVPSEEQIKAWDEYHDDFESAMQVGSLNKFRGAEDGERIVHMLHSPSMVPGDESTAVRRGMIRICHLASDRVRIVDAIKSATANPSKHADSFVWSELKRLLEPGWQSSFLHSPEIMLRAEYMEHFGKVRIYQFFIQHFLSKHEPLSWEQVTSMIDTLDQLAEVRSRLIQQGIKPPESMEKIVQEVSNVLSEYRELSVQQKNSTTDPVQMICAGNKTHWIRTNSKVTATISNHNRFARLRISANGWRIGL